MVTCQTELKTFQASLPNFLTSKAGQFVVIQGSSLLGFFPTYAEALDWAYDNLGLERFFVRQVNDVEPVAHFSRDLGPCER